MKYLALLTGKGGEGCDYTIGCNLKAEIFEAPNDDEALKKVFEEFKEYGGCNCRECDRDGALETIRLFRVDAIEVPLIQWRDTAHGESQDAKYARELRLAEETLAKLKQRKA